LSLTKSGGKRGGSSIFRATLPTSWIREMGLSEETRNIKLFFDGEQIIIKNNEEEIKMLEKLLEKARKEIEKEINRAGYIDDSDLTDRFLDNLAYELTMNNEKIDQDEVLQAIKDKIMIEYNKIGYVNDAADYTGCYYKDIKDAIKWANNWYKQNIFEAHKEFVETYGIDVTLEQFAEVYGVDIEDYL
jgi:hypothetical protein